jgi:Cys-rich protein (TIGR01571 family)
MMRTNVNGAVHRSWVGNLFGCCGCVHACFGGATPHDTAQDTPSHRAPRLAHGSQGLQHLLLDHLVPLLRLRVRCPAAPPSAATFGCSTRQYTTVVASHKPGPVSHVRRENYRRAFRMNRTALAALFFFCLYCVPNIANGVVNGSCAKYYTVGSPTTSASPSPAYGTCSSVFPNGTNVTMPSVGNSNPQLQNMAQVSCAGSGTTYWVATINNQCAAPACFTSAGVACTAGTAGCPCTVVTACTPQVATSPVPCLLCPPAPCVVCPPLPPPPAPSAPPTPAVTSNTTTSSPNAAAPAAAVSNGTSAVVRRRLSIFGGGSSGGGRSSGGGGGGRYVAPTRNNYNRNNNRNNYQNNGAAAPAGSAVGSACVTAACLSCQAHMSSITTPIVCIIVGGFILFAGYMRYRLHQAYNIQKDQICCVEDSWLPWWFFPWCALCQEARTIDVMERDQELVEGIQDPQAAPLMKQM